MMFKNLEELKECLCAMGHGDSVVFENPDFVGAAVGVTETGRVVMYGFDGC